MSEKPSGIAHHAVIHHLACIFLSLSLLSLLLLMPLLMLYSCYHSTSYNHVNNVTFISLQTSIQGQVLCDKLCDKCLILKNCDSIYLMLGFNVTITVIYVMSLLHSFGELAIGLALHVYHMQILIESHIFPYAPVPLCRIYCQTRTNGKSKKFMPILLCLKGQMHKVIFKSTKIVRTLLSSS